MEIHIACQIKGLVTNYGEGGGGLHNGRWRHVKFYPCEKGGGSGQSFSHAEGGGGAQKVSPDCLLVCGVS